MMILIFLLILALEMVPAVAKLLTAKKISNRCAALFMLFNLTTVFLLGAAVLTSSTALLDVALLHLLLPVASLLLLLAHSTDQRSRSS